MTTSMLAHRDRTEWTPPSDVTELVLAIASGDLDAWSGRMLRAGVDRPARLVELAAARLSGQARTISLVPYGEDDPLA